MALFSRALTSENICLTKELGFIVITDQVMQLWFRQVMEVQLLQHAMQTGEMELVRLGKGYSGSSSLKSVWVPIKSRGNTSSVACGDDSSIFPGLKIGGITIDKPELAASTISGLKIAAARLRFGSVQTSEISGDGIQQQQRQPGACHSQGIATEKGNLRLEVDQQKYLKEASSGLRTASASSSVGLVMKRSSAGASKNVTEQPGISLAEGNIFTSKIAGYQHKLGNLVGNRIKSVAPVDELADSVRRPELASFKYFC